MAIPEVLQEMYRTLQRVCLDEDMILAEWRDKVTGEPRWFVTAVVPMDEDKQNLAVIPLAEMVPRNVLDELDEFWEHEQTA